MFSLSADSYALSLRGSIAIFLFTIFLSSAAQSQYIDYLIPNQIISEPGCNFRIIDVSTGKNKSKNLVPGPASFFGNINRAWICIRSDDVRVGFHGIAIFDSSIKRWTLDWSRIVGAADSRSEERWLYRWFGGNYKLTQLNSADSSGYIIVDTTQTRDGSIPAEFDKKAQKMALSCFRSVWSVRLRRCAAMECSVRSNM